MSIDVGAKARLNYAKVQQDSTASAHLAATGLRLGEGAFLRGFKFLLAVNWQG